MFGYVRAYSPDMRMREYTLYRGVYCGLCRTMRRDFSWYFSLSLSYDFVFYALVRSLLHGEKFELEGQRCFVHPLKKRPSAKSCRALSDSAKAAAILICGKLDDDISDERGIKRFARRLLRPFARQMRKKALSDADFAAADAEVSAALSELAELESTSADGGALSPDAAAELSGKALAALAAAGTDRSSEGRIFREIGRRLGRWIYLADALDDYRDDCQSGAFNPFKFGKLPPREDAETALNLECAALLSAAELLLGADCGDAAESIRNVICLGMPQAAKRVLSKVYGGEDLAESDDELKGRELCRGCRG